MKIIRNYNFKMDIIDTERIKKELKERNITSYETFFDRYNNTYMFHIGYTLLFIHAWITCYEDRIYFDAHIDGEYIREKELFSIEELFKEIDNIKEFSIFINEKKNGISYD